MTNRSMPRGRAAFLAVAVSGLLGLAACAAPPSGTTQSGTTLSGAQAGSATSPGARPVATTPDQPLEGVAWRLTQLDGQPVPPAQDQRAPYLQFDAQNRRVSGSGGCNRLTGAYLSGPGTLRIGPVASTRMACLGQDTGQRETRFFAVLEATTGYRITGRELTLTDGSGQVLAVLEEATLR